MKLYGASLFVAGVANGITINECDRSAQLPAHKGMVLSKQVRE
jgi:hypothetical protein